jgi:hypothetical protein
MLRSITLIHSIGLLQVHTKDNRKHTHYQSETKPQFWLPYPLLLPLVIAERYSIPNIQKSLEQKNS